MCEFGEFQVMHCINRRCEFGEFRYCNDKNNKVSLVSFKIHAMMAVFGVGRVSFKTNSHANSHANSHTFPVDSGELENGMGSDSVRCEFGELFSNPTYVRDEISKYARINEIDQNLCTAAGNNSSKLTNSHAPFTLLFLHYLKKNCCSFG